MDDKLFEEYQQIRGRLERLIEQTSRDEVVKLLVEDFEIIDDEAICSESTNEDIDDEDDDTHDRS